jgi:cysteine desulfurase/selenocysteine lyase
LDNAATSFPKPYKVYEAIGRCLKYYCANPGRSGHQMSIDSGMVVYETRVTISKFFNFENPLQFCFTKNATEALNIALKGILRPNTHVITTSMEHNSVLRPLKYLEKYNGVEVSIVYGNSFGEIDPDSIRKCIKSNTAIIVATLSSNVNGTILPILPTIMLPKSLKISLTIEAVSSRLFTAIPTTASRLSFSIVFHLLSLSLSGFHRNTTFS